MNFAYLCGLCAEFFLPGISKCPDESRAITAHQTLTYLRLSNCQIALLMNFNVVIFKDGLRRFIP